MALGTLTQMKLKLKHLISPSTAEVARWFKKLTVGNHTIPTGNSLFDLKFPHFIICTRSECQSQIHKYPGARYKKFPTVSEAWTFINGESSLGSKSAANGE